MTVLALSLAVLTAGCGDGSDASPTSPINATNAPPAALLDRLPALADLPEGFSVTAEGERNAVEVSAEWPDPGALRDDLEEWGFVGSAYREFQLPAPELATAEAVMTGMTATLYHFGSPEQAEQAAHRLLDQQMDIEGADLEEADSPDLEHFSVAAHGTVTAQGRTAVVAALYVVVSDLVYYFGGVSLGHDSLPDIIAIATATIE